MRFNPLPPEGTSDKSLTQLIKVLILFDSFVFTKTQCQYSTYKRELCTIVKFACKYRYYFICLGSIILTDHKPLTSFLDSPYVKGIYARQSTKLSTLHVSIQQIKGKKNVVTDSLSRTVFPDLDSTNKDLKSLRHIKGDYKKTDRIYRQIQKDRKGSYEQLLKL